MPPLLEYGLGHYSNEFHINYAHKMSSLINFPAALRPSAKRYLSNGITVLTSGSQWEGESRTHALDLIPQLIVEEEWCVGFCRSKIVGLPIESLQ